MAFKFPCNGGTGALISGHMLASSFKVMLSFNLLFLLLDAVKSAVVGLKVGVSAIEEGDMIC